MPQVSKSFLSVLLNISRKSLYLVSQKQLTKDEILRDEILKVLDQNPSYGHRRVALELGIGKRRARRVMKKYGIKPYKRKARWTKRDDQGRPPAPYQNLVKGTWPKRPGQILVRDFTYLVFKSKRYYLATYMDLFTREIVGWYVSSRHTKDLVLEAFLDTLRTLDGLPQIVHTDQGAEYTSKEYINFLTEMSINISMSKKASPWENGFQESFYNNFKTDLGLEFDRFNSLGQFIEAIHQTISYYNSKRIHTKLKMPPIEFRQKFV